MTAKNGKDIKCKNCSNLFYVPQCYIYSKKYCSKKCAKEDDYGFKPRDKECVVCGNAFTINNSLRTQDKTCSSKCRNDLLKLHRNNAEIKKKNTVHRTNCKFCGKEVVSTKYCPQNFCGGKFGQCFKDNLSRERQGKKNPSYRNGLAISGGRTYTGIHLRACSKYRKSFLEKNNYLFCEVCGVNENGTPKFEVHHIYYASLYPKHAHLHDFANLILVCIGCHNKFHSSTYKNEFLKIERERGLKELFGCV